MRPFAFASAAASFLASCTLLVAVDDDLSVDATAPDAPRLGGDAAPAPEAGEEAGGPLREGCPGPPDDPDLVAWYPLDETAGTVAHDCSPGELDLLPLAGAGPAWVAGKIGGGADFDGIRTCLTADDGRAHRFDDGSPFTVMAWTLVRQFKMPNNTGRWIASHKVSPWGWHFGADDPARMEIDFEFGTGNKTSVSAVASAQTWSHVAATYAPGAAAMYLDGVLTEGKQGPAIPASFQTTGTGFFRIGCRSEGSQPYDGIIDDVRIYRRALTAAEIAAVAQRGR